MKLNHRISGRSYVLIALAAACTASAGSLKAVSVSMVTSTFNPSDYGQKLSYNDYYAPNDPGNWQQAQTFDLNGNLTAYSNWTNSDGGGEYPDGTQYDVIIPTGDGSYIPGANGVNTVSVNTLTLQDSTSTLGIWGGQTLQVGGDVSNSGTISVDGQFQILADVALNGTGTLNLSSYNGGNGSIGSTGAGYALTNSNGHTISGGGTISAMVTNNGLIEATQSTYDSTITVDAALTNNSTMEASTNAELAIYDTVSQSGGAQLQADGTGSQVVLYNGASIGGGTLDTANGGVINVAGNNTATISGLTNQGSLNIGGGGVLNASGAITDNGYISAAGEFQILADTTLGGTGTLNLSSYNGGNGSIGSTGAGYALTNSNGHTISGGGTISAMVTNNGLIEATQSTYDSTITLNAAVTNPGIMEGGNNATLTLNGPVVQVAGNTLTGGTWIVDSYGQINIPGANITTNAATIILYGANTSFPAITAMTANTGTFELENGAKFTTAGDFTNTGTVDVGGASTLTIQGNYTQISPGTTTVNGSLVLNNGGSLSIANGTTVDISNTSASTVNANVLINYGSAGSPNSAIRNYLISGYNAGAWNGPGISSTAAAISGGVYSLGYADGADGVVSGLAAGQEKIMYTLAGDANLDGTVTLPDFAILRSNFGKTGMQWDQGDFNYDGTVNLPDFAILRSNFGKTLGPAAATSSTPEPATLGLLAMGGLGLLVRTRRGRVES
jgi:hypothetical protein